MGYDEKINVLNSYREILTNFCKGYGISPYNFLLLSLSSDCATTNDLEMRLKYSEFGSPEGSDFSWFKSNGDRKSFSINAVKFSMKNHLKIRNLIDLQAHNQGSHTLTHITLTAKGKDLLIKWESHFMEFMEKSDLRENERRQISEELKEHLDLSKLVGKEKFVLKISELPKHIKAQFEERAEKAYLALCETLLSEVDDIETSKRLKGLPVFLEVPSKRQTVEYSKDYFRGGLTSVRGWFVGYSPVQTLNLGSLYRCVENSKHIKIAEEKATKDSGALCPYCQNLLEEVAPIDLPVYKVIIETRNMEKIEAFIHADLWRPGNSSTDEKKVLLFKLDEKGTFKNAKKIKYMVIGMEEEKKNKVNMEKAKQLGSKSTKEILDIIDNSLFSDLSGAKLIKNAAIISLGSTNTRELKVKIRGEWKIERGIINQLVWGIEGTAKTQIGQRMVDLISHHLAKGQAGNTSIRGLTASYDTETKYVRAGILPLNDSRAVLIDELDKFDDYSSLLEPLESKILHYSKGGIHVTYPCNTVIFMTANNKNAIESNALEQMKKELELKGKHRNPIIDRCDIIISVSQQVDSGVILAGWLESSTSIRLPREDIMNYFEAIRSIKEVTVDQPALRYLQTVIAPTNVQLTARRLKSFMRIAGAIAKLHLRSDVQPVDIDDAFEFYVEMLQNLGLTTHDIQKIDGATQWEKTRQLIINKLRSVSATTEDLQDMLGVSFIPDVLLDLERKGIVWKDPNNLWRPKK